MQKHDISQLGDDDDLSLSGVSPRVAWGGAIAGLLVLVVAVAARLGS